MLKLRTPPDARKRSAKERVALPNAPPSLLYGKRLPPNEAVESTANVDDAKRCSALNGAETVEEADEMKPPERVDNPSTVNEEALNAAEIVDEAVPMNPPPERMENKVSPVELSNRMNSPVSSSDDSVCAASRRL